jgi:hypothetical protein
LENWYNSWIRTEKNYWRTASFRRFTY